MSGAEIAAIIAAIGGLLTACFAGYRALRGDKVSEEANKAASVLTGLQGLVTTLQAEVTRVTAELDRLRDQHIEDRTAWELERKAIREEHYAEMKRMRAEHLQEIREAYERMEELGSKLYVALNRPPEARTRKTDRET